MSIQAGFGRGIITPPLPVVLAGFSARKGAVNEVRDDLEARALVVRDGEVTLCLLVLDLLLLGADFAADVRAAVGAALAIPPAQVLTSCTHTHSGPFATATATRTGWTVPPGYRELLVAACTETALAARDSLEPVTLAYGRDTLPEGISRNRRGLPYHPEFAVLEARRPDGSRLGTIANVGIHPVALGPSCRAVSGDWVRTYRDDLERATGAPAILLPGALGDVNPVEHPHEHPEQGNWRGAELVGADVATAVQGLLPRLQPAGDRFRIVAHREVELRTGVTVASLLSGVARTPVPVELIEWELGGIRLVSLPGEAFHALGRAVERARGDRVLLAGLSPAWLGYLPAPFRLGYEESMSYGHRFVAPLRTLLVEPPA